VSDTTFWSVCSYVHASVGLSGVCTGFNSIACLDWHNSHVTEMKVFNTGKSGYFLTKSLMCSYLLELTIFEAILAILAANGQTKPKCFVKTNRGVDEEIL